MSVISSASLAAGPGTGAGVCKAVSTTTPCSGAGGGGASSGSGATAFSSGSSSDGSTNAGASEGTLRGVGSERGPPQTGQAPRPWVREHAFSDGDLLLSGGQMGRGRVLVAAVGTPRLWRELQSALVAIAGIDGPVASGLAAGHLVPFAVAGRAAWPASARPLPPRTAPVTAILATVTARCGSGLRMSSTQEGV